MTNWTEEAARLLPCQWVTRLCDPAYEEICYGCQHRPAVPGDPAVNVPKACYTTVMKTKFLVLVLSLFLTNSVFGQANLTWVDNSTDETGFVLERQLNAGAFVVLASALAANLVSYTDGTAVGSTAQANTYCYRVKAFNATGPSAYSNTACKTFPKLPTAPNAPSGLQVSAISQTEIQLGWLDKSNNELGFQAERIGAGEVKLVEYSMNQTSAVDGGLRRNTRYDYRIRALGDAGTSEWSNRVKTKTWR